MWMAEAESFFTDESRLAVDTQLSTALRKFWVELRFAKALAVARSEKTDWSAGNALRKLNMQLLASLLLRGGPFFCFGKKKMKIFNF